MKIREAKIKDLPLIQKLNHELFVHDFPFDEYLFKNWPFSKDGEKYFRKVITNNKFICLFAEEKDEIIGYLVGKIGIPWSPRPVKTAEFDNMLVKENFRGKGIGKKLVEGFLSWCRKKKVKSVLVMAYSGNKEALKFYKQCGFANLEERLEIKLSS